MCFVLPPFSSKACHACKCCPVIGHCVLTYFIPTNWTKVIGVMLKVLRKKRVHQMCEHFIIGSLSLPPSLSLTLSVTADCLQLWSSKPTTLVPTPPIQLSTGSQWEAWKWVSDYQFPGCSLASWTADGCRPMSGYKHTEARSTTPSPEPPLDISGNIQTFVCYMRWVDLQIYLGYCFLFFFGRFLAILETLLTRDFSDG